jgi:hypothetical protein
VPFDHPSRLPAFGEGSLIPSAEAKGFRLHATVWTGSSLYTEIAWQVPHHTTRFHTCLCRFEVDDSGVLNEGVWEPFGLIGIAPLLAEQLHGIVPGAPTHLLSAAGWGRVRSEISKPKFRLTEKT